VKNPESIFEFIQHPYPADIYFIANEHGWKKFISEPRFKGLEDTSYPTHHGSVTNLTSDDLAAVPVHVITFSDLAEKLNSAQVIGLMVHELTHVLQKLQVAARETFDAETQAYLMQRMTMWLLARYKQAGRKYKK
jgi:hypothetical protein